MAQTMRGQGLVRPGETVLAAVSGGADSVALLLLLCAVKDALSIRVACAHYEHGIRGEASREDARFVAALCESLDVPCAVGHGDVPTLRQQWRCSLEDAARRARYAFLDEAATAAGASRIALAHQREDQAETLLLHLVHGCGLDGLAAMRPLSGNRIRPLLDISRAELEAYLTARGVTWREDETNTDTAYARNLLRREVFPLLTRLNPRVTEAMTRTAAQAARTADTLADIAASRLEGCVKRMPYGAFWLADDGHAQAETIRAFAAWTGVPPLDMAQTDALARLGVGETVNLPEDWRAVRTKERLHLLRPEPDVMNDLTHRVTREDVEAAALSGYGDGIHTQALDAETLGNATFRTRRDGDTFAPMAGGTQKLKQTLRDVGIDRPFRDLLPVLADGSRVLWIVGLKPARDAAIGPRTRRAVRFTYDGLLPWEMPVPERI